MRHRVVSYLISTAVPVEASDVVIRDQRGSLETVHTLHAAPVAAARSSAASRAPIVMLPGYAAGAAMFYHQFKTLSQQADVYAIDLTGNGLSSRPRFAVKGVKDTEQFHIDCIEVCIMK